jgi:hypothetical protein
MSVTQVAVIIVTFRTAALTINCLRSIEEQRHIDDLRITAVVVDNSADDFCLIQRAIETSGWAHWVKLAAAPKNGGFAYGNNLGIQLARTDGSPDYIHLLNPDTMLSHGAIHSLVRFLQSHPKAGIAGSSFENLDGSDWPFAFHFPTMISEIEEGLQLGIASRVLRRWVVAKRMGKIPEPVDWVPGASMMVRKDVFDSIGGLDENYFLYFEETDFCYRAKRSGFAAWYVPESRVMHIAGQSTKITERNAARRRQPPYWFESRRRFFIVTHGVNYARATDVVAILAHCLGIMKRFVLGRRHDGTPFFIRDLVRHSPLWAKNR